MNDKPSHDVRPGRLTDEQIAANFADMHPPLTPSEAIIDADRCYFCYDAPCTTACPTGIDIPGFIQKIRSGNLKGSAHTILSENIMGGMCARVCPTEVLCEEACVRNTHEDRPVRIGLLQRYATDPIFENGTPLFERAPPTGRKVAVVGGGPAGLSCAHRLAMLGHGVTVFEPKDKLGGLNEYGIAAYKTVDDFAAREVEYILGIGGIEVRTGVALGKDISLAELRKSSTRCSSASASPASTASGSTASSSRASSNAVDYIAALRQAPDKASLPVGRRVVVIGGGMTAIDIAVQSKALGAEEVTMVYRRGQEHMSASRYEQEFAQTRGVRVRTLGGPRSCSSRTGASAASSSRHARRPTASSKARANLRARSGRRVQGDRAEGAVGSARRDTARDPRAEAGPHRRATTSGGRRCPACGPAAIASPAARTSLCPRCRTASSPRCPSTVF